MTSVGATHSHPSTDYLVPNTQRRVLRQSTLPNSLANNDPNLSGSGANLTNYNYVNLTAPTSPHQMQKSPIYPNTYNSDDVIHMSSTDCDNYTNQIQQHQQQPQPMNIHPQAAQSQQQAQSGINPQTHHRLQVRRQSTLPANPCQPPIYLSTSPNRPYSRSPERSPGEQRYPPFVRQTSFPCNMSETSTQQLQQQQQTHLNIGSGGTAPSQSYLRKLLPTSPNYQASAIYQQQQQPSQQPQQAPTHANYDPQTGLTQTTDELDYIQVIPKPRMLRQATLPNPDQHVKLLPTSPPKRQTSPQYRRSPEFMRQQTLPNPEAFSSNSLAVPQAQAQTKFAPLSPRHKQNFLFPNIQNPRQFLSQQHVPAVGSGSGDVSTTGIGIGVGAGEQYSSSQSVNIQSRDHAKMMKVRSHSNEEYSITKPYHSENRRLLPEIPTISRSMSRSPSRLVRQECVKDDRNNTTDYGTRTFGEAKQQFNQFQNVTEDAENRPEYMDYFGDSTSSFLEADEVQYEKSYNAGFSSEPRIIYNDGSDDGSYNQYQRPIVHSAENVLIHDKNYSYYGPEGGSNSQPLGGGVLNIGSAGALPRTPQMHNRLRRRQSRELQMHQEEMAHLNRHASNATCANATAESAGGVGDEGGGGGGNAEMHAPAIGSTAGSSANDDKSETHERRKPEQMRSISEDSGAKPNAPKPVTRRSMSHPEKETQTNKKVEPTKIPSPRPLADILDKTRTNTKIPTPRRRNIRGTNGAEAEEGTNKPYSNERRNSVVSLRSATSNKRPSQQYNADEQRAQSQFAKENGNNKTIEPKSRETNENTKMKDHDNYNGVQAKNAVDMQKQNTKDDTTESNKDGTVEGRTIPKQHTTTLGEQEIQNAVEAAAVIFKKVVLQRRQEKKAAEEDIYDMETSSELEFKSITFNHQHYNMDADEFKLVFINSPDSSASSTSKDEEFEDSSSTTSSTQNYSSITIDDCDWDYFEPSMICTSGSITKQIFYSPCNSPMFTRHRMAMRDFKYSESTASPTESPLLYRKSSPRVYCSRIRESDTGTDEELLMQGESSSQTSSDGYFVRAPVLAAGATATGRQHYQRHQHQQPQQQLSMKTTRIKTRCLGKESKHYRHHHHHHHGAAAKQLQDNGKISNSGCGVCSCGGTVKTPPNTTAQPQPQYVPIPVPVPIPIPMAAFHNWQPATVLKGAENVPGHAASHSDILQMMEKDEQLRASLKKLWGTAGQALSQDTSEATNNMQAAAAAAVVAAYSSVSNYQHLSAKRQADDYEVGILGALPVVGVNAKLARAGFKSSTPELSASMYSQSSSSGYGTTATAGSLETLTSSGLAEFGSLSRFSASSLQQQQNLLVNSYGTQTANSIATNTNAAHLPTTEDANNKTLCYASTNTNANHRYADNEHKRGARLAYELREPQTLVAGIPSTLANRGFKETDTSRISNEVNACEVFVKNDTPTVLVSKGIKTTTTYYNAHFGDKRADFDNAIPTNPVTDRAINCVADAGVAVGERAYVDRQLIEKNSTSAISNDSKFCIAKKKQQEQLRNETSADEKSSESNQFVEKITGGEQVGRVNVKTSLAKNSTANVGNEQYKYNKTQKTKTISNSATDQESSGTVREEKTYVPSSLLSTSSSSLHSSRNDQNIAKQTNSNALAKQVLKTTTTPTASTIPIALPRTTTKRISGVELNLIRSSIAASARSTKQSHDQHRVKNNSDAQDSGSSHTAQLQGCRYSSLVEKPFTTNKQNKSNKIKEAANNSWDNNNATTRTRFENSCAQASLFTNKGAVKSPSIAHANDVGDIKEKVVALRRRSGNSNITSSVTTNCNYEQSRQSSENVKGIAKFIENDSTIDCELERVGKTSCGLANKASTCKTVVRVTRTSEETQNKNIEENDLLRKIEENNFENIPKKRVNETKSYSAMISVGKLKNDAANAGGYLQSENVFSSSDTESTASGDTDTDEYASGDDNKQAKGKHPKATNSRESAGGTRRSVQRSYDIASVAGIDELIVSHMDDDDDHDERDGDVEAGTSSNAESNAHTRRPYSRSSATSAKDQNTNTSSETSSSSSSETVDSDDTGTIADRRPKSKHFSKIFVVNPVPREQRHRGDSTSSENDSQSSDANLEDSSDNDTDTERTDCGIVLNSVKVISEEQAAVENACRRRRGAHESESDATSDNELNVEKIYSDDDCDDGNNYERAAIESECSHISGKYVATYEAEDLANSIIRFSGADDNDNKKSIEARGGGDSGGVVLHAIRLLNDEEVERHVYERKREYQHAVDVAAGSSNSKAHGVDGTVNKKVASAADNKMANAAKLAKNENEKHNENINKNINIDKSIARDERATQQTEQLTESTTYNDGKKEAKKTAVAMHETIKHGTSDTPTFVFDFNEPATIITKTALTSANDSATKTFMRDICDWGIDTQEACNELHSISNDVNRLLALTKQHSELELKLQKLRRGVEEINQDHLLVADNKTGEEEEGESHTYATTNAPPTTLKSSSVAAVKKESPESEHSGLNDDDNSTMRKNNSDDAPIVADNDTYNDESRAHDDVINMGAHCVSKIGMEEASGAAWVPNAVGFATADAKAQERKREQQSIECDMIEDETKNSCKTGCQTINDEEKTRTLAPKLTNVDTSKTKCTEAINETSNEAYENMNAQKTADAGNDEQVQFKLVHTFRGELGGAAEKMSEVETMERNALLICENEKIVNEARYEDTAKENTAEKDVTEDGKNEKNEQYEKNLKSQTFNQINEIESRAHCMGAAEISAGNKTAFDVEILTIHEEGEDYENEQKIKQPHVNNSAEIMDKHNEVWVAYQCWTENEVAKNNSTQKLETEQEKQKNKTRAFAEDQLQGDFKQQIWRNEKANDNLVLLGETKMPQTSIQEPTDETEKELEKCAKYEQQASQKFIDEKEIEGKEIASEKGKEVITDKKGEVKQETKVVVNKEREVEPNKKRLDDEENEDQVAKAKNEIKEKVECGKLVSKNEMNNKTEEIEKTEAIKITKQAKKIEYQEGHNIQQQPAWLSRFNEACQIANELATGTTLTPAPQSLSGCFMDSLETTSLPDDTTTTTAYTARSKIAQKTLKAITAKTIATTSNTANEQQALKTPEQIVCTETNRALSEIAALTLAAADTEHPTVETKEHNNTLSAQVADVKLQIVETVEKQKSECEGETEIQVMAATNEKNAEEAKSAAALLTKAIIHNVKEHEGVNANNNNANNKNNEMANKATTTSVANAANLMAAEAIRALYANELANSLCLVENEMLNVKQREHKANDGAWSDDCDFGNKNKILLNSTTKSVGANALQIHEKQKSVTEQTKEEFDEYDTKSGVKNKLHEDYVDEEKELKNITKNGNQSEHTGVSVEQCEIVQSVQNDNDKKNNKQKSNKIKYKASANKQINAQVVLLQNKAIENVKGNYEKELAGEHVLERDVHENGRDVSAVQTKQFSTKSLTSVDYMPANALEKQQKQAPSSAFGCDRIKVEHSATETADSFEAAVASTYAPSVFSINNDKNDYNESSSYSGSKQFDSIFGGGGAPAHTTRTKIHSPATPASTTSLSAKYRSLIMITKDNSNSGQISSGNDLLTARNISSSGATTTTTITTIESTTTRVKPHIIHDSRDDINEGTTSIGCARGGAGADCIGSSAHGGSIIRLSGYEGNKESLRQSISSHANQDSRTSFGDARNTHSYNNADDGESPKAPSSSATSLLYVSSAVGNTINNNNSKVTLSYPVNTVDLLREQKIAYGDFEEDEEDFDNLSNGRGSGRSSRAGDNDDGDNGEGDFLPEAQHKNKKTKTNCLEEGLADDDSWVEEISQRGDEDFGDDTTPTASDSEDMSMDGDDTVSAHGMFIDREEELRGYHRSTIDFTLHTIVEESCEESEVASLRGVNEEGSEDMDELERRRQRTINHHNRLSASDLEKYFFFDLGDGKVMSSIDTRGDDTASEVSSECSEGLDSLGGMHEEHNANDSNSAAELASSRLEKYFLSGFMGFSNSDKNESDESGSVGSDSEGHPSPSQRRKRLVRARGTPRSHNSSLDNLLVDAQSLPADSLEPSLMTSTTSDLLDSSESEACDETVLHVSSRCDDKAFESSNSSDTMKRKKQVRKRHDSLDEKKLQDSADDANKSTIAGSTNTAECRTPTPGSISSAQAKKQQHRSRDSGFVGSNDDLLKSPDCELPTTSAAATRTKSPTALEQIEEIKESAACSSTTNSVPVVLITTPHDTTCTLQRDGLTPKPPLPPAAANASLSRKDSFNNWSSDEETNLMMSKMRQFFKTLVVATANAQQNYSSAGNSNGPTPNQTTPTSVRRMKSAGPQLAYFENELTRLMKTVPGINDDQVREIVEYLSSEDTWSDSCDSSDYTSSDLEGSNRRKGELKEQISASCQQIINKFEIDEEGDRGDGGLLEVDTHELNPDTALVYQKLMASFSKIAVGNPNNTAVNMQITTGDEQPTTSSAVEGVTQKPVEEDQISTGSTQSTERSPQLFAKVMQHIGTRLVALMHEVNSGNDSHGTNSPIAPQRNHHKRLQAKISITTTEDEEEESASENDQTKVGAHSTHSLYQQNHHLHHHTTHHLASHQTKTNKALQDDANNLARSKSHDLLLDSASTSAACSSNVSGSSSSAATRPHYHQSSSGVSDTAGEECGVASDYERFSWRGSFESALLANGDSRTKLSQLDRDNSSSASALAVAKRRSAGDLLFNHKSMSREQLDRVRSCGSIGGGDERHQELEASPAKPWVSTNDCKDVRRSSVPDAIYESDTSDEDAFGARSTLPRSLTGGVQVASTNSLPRLPTTSTGASAFNTPVNSDGLNATSTAMASSSPLTKSQSALNYGSGGSAKSARYRSPSLASRASASLNAKKTSAGLGLQHFLYSKRDARKRLSMSGEEAKAAAEEVTKSPVTVKRNEAAASPIQSRGSATSETWPTQSDEDIDRLVAMHQNRDSLSSLGLRSDSMASVYSGAGEGRYGTVVVKGQVEFGIQYNYKLGALEIHVVRCKDLAAVDAKRNRSDPYVKVYLLPDKSKAGKRKTKVKKHTLNPIFDEVLRFHMPVSSLESRTLWLTVWHSDMFGRNDFLGEVSVNLQGKVFDNPQSQWYLLQERSEPFDEVATYRGDIVVGLKYIPPEMVRPGFKRSASTSSGSSNLRKFGSIKSVASRSDRSAKGGQLHVLVKEAKHLTPIKVNGTCDAFCKSYLLPDRTRSSKQKTPVVKRSLHPTWNYTFIYDDVSLYDLSERALELTVWDHDRLASNEFLGGIRFSLGTGKSYGRPVEWMDATGKELSLWQNMIDRPNFWVEGSLVLRSTLEGIRAIP